MAFKRSQRSAVSLENAEALFRDLRSRTIQGLLSQQADILREYHSTAQDSPDIAIQLPTGSGKTLVGLLIGEWRRRARQEKIVYLCPTNQLVHQVVDQARHYGIKGIPFVGGRKLYSQSDKSDYLAGDVVAVSNYSSLFNSNSFFKDADTLILDDAHAAENYVAKYWSATITRRDSPVLFDSFCELLRPSLDSTSFARLTSGGRQLWEMGWVDKLPTADLLEIVSSIEALLDTHLAGLKTSLAYAWRVLREHLLASHIYLSPGTILIRPFIPPTFSHPPFTNPKQRVYMSATLGFGGDLERLWGRPKIKRLPVPSGWDRQGIGRRLFFFPERELSPEAAIELTARMAVRAKRAFILVTDDDTVDEISEKMSSKGQFILFRTAQIESSKHPFVDTNNAVAIVANRYDGIDLSGDDCRLLVVAGLPQSVNLQERFFISRLNTGSLLTDRILTRVAQAVGRCTRSATDYAAVVVLGEELNTFFLNQKKRELFHPEIQAEIVFGLNQSRGISSDEMFDNLDIFLNHGLDWNDADGDIISLRDSQRQMQIPGKEKLEQSVVHELEYQRRIWDGQYEQAVDAARQVLAVLNGDEVSGYRAFWNYLAGAAATLASAAGVAGMGHAAREHYNRAFKTASSVRWLMRLARSSSPDAVSATDEALAAVIERLEARLAALGTTNARKFEAAVSGIVRGLASNDSKSFEASHEQLGSLLGYESGNSEADAAPDPWWIADEHLCFVFEDHTNLEHPDDPQELGANKVRQAKSHPDWIRLHVNGLAKNAVVLPIIVTPCRALSTGAVPHVGALTYWEMSDLRAFSQRALGVVRELWQSFPGEGDEAWRLQAARLYREHGLAPSSILAKLRASPLSALPVGMAEVATKTKSKPGLKNSEGENAKPEGKSKAMPAGRSTQTASTPADGVSSGPRSAAKEQPTEQDPKNDPGKKEP